MVVVDVEPPSPTITQTTGESTACSATTGSMHTADASRQAVSGRVEEKPSRENDAEATGSFAELSYSTQEVCAASSREQSLVNCGQTVDSAKAPSSLKASEQLGNCMSAEDSASTACRGTGEQRCEAESNKGQVTRPKQQLQEQRFLLNLVEGCFLKPHKRLEDSGEWPRNYHLSALLAEVIFPGSP